MMLFAGASLKEAVEMASQNPAQLLGQEVVRLRRGSLADLVIFHVPGSGQKLVVEATIASGEVKFGEIVARSG